MIIRILLSLFLALGLALPGWADCRPHTVAPSQIPEAAWRTLATVRRTGEAPPDQVGGRRFGNYGRGGEEKLPVRGPGGRRIDYREWDIHPRSSGRNRGPERVVTGSDGRAWYTADHYCSFTEMKR
jgi:guanyl-specific ribonuclease Sa